MYVLHVNVKFLCIEKVFLMKAIAIAKLDICMYHPSKGVSFVYLSPLALALLNPSISV